MSAFMVSDKHIVILTEALCRCNREMSIYTPFGQIAHTLWEQNARSLRARYKDADTMIPPEPDWEQARRFFHLPYSTVQLLKLAHCYDYQACETEDYKDGNVAFDFSQTLQSLLVRQLPGYDAAEWAI
jgi:hypothetical protein